MSSLKIVAIAGGTGHFGKFLSDEFLRLKSRGAVDTVKVLTRSDSARSDTIAELEKGGAEIIPVDYSNVSAVASALAHVDVVISAFGGGGFESQDLLIKAAKEANVKLFVPSEFGPENTDLKEGDLLWRKVPVLQQLKDLELPYTLFFCGYWQDFLFLADYFGFDFKNRRAKIYDTGDTPISWTARHDVARYVAHILSTRSLEKLKWATLRFEAERLSWNQLVESWQAKSEQVLEITRLPREELEAREINKADRAASLLLGMENGYGTVGKESELNNDLFPGWKPVKVLDILLP